MAIGPTAFTHPVYESPPRLILHHRRSRIPDRPGYFTEYVELSCGHHLPTEILSDGQVEALCYVCNCANDAAMGRPPSDLAKQLFFPSSSQTLAGRDTPKP